MAKIIAPNKDYNEESATVSFVNGVGETLNPWLISWFKSNGYEVQEAEQQADEEAESQEDEAEFPKHVGGGNYELSEREKTRLSRLRHS